MYGPVGSPFPKRTKDKLGLDQMGVSRIKERHYMANMCSDVVTLADFGLKWPYEPQLRLRPFQTGGSHGSVPCVTGLQSVPLVRSRVGGAGGPTELELLEWHSGPTCIEHR